MWFQSLLASWKSALSRRPRSRPRPARRRLTVKPLESRLMPSLFALASFNGTDGAYPSCALVMDSSGNLYGTTESWGASGVGTIFELAHGSGTITTLASFNGTNGSQPRAGLIMDSSGNLYGTTSCGGPTYSGHFSSGDGTIFELAHGSGTITTLASFNGTDGAYPDASLIMDSSGNLFGTTRGGGASGYGTVFELQAGSGTITTLASFNGTDGAYPRSALIMDSSGNLYGTTSDGGASWGSGNGGLGYGTVFELQAGSGTISTLASFNGTDGAYPSAGLIMDSSGNLYGTASHGGVRGVGTIFELAHDSGTIKTLASFIAGEGTDPEAGLMMDSSGNLYGTTEYPGGTIFELPHDSTIKTLALLGGTDGEYPEASLIMDSSGNLYGTAPSGGTSDFGTIFELTGAATPAVQAIAAGFVVSTGQPVAGGAVLSSGALTLENGTLFEDNWAIGYGEPGGGGNAAGGALYIAGGTANISDTTLTGNYVDGVQSNTATYGGGLYIAAGTVTLSNTTVEANSATDYGGRIYIVSAATLYVDPFTVANTFNNTDDSGTNGSTANVDGAYILT